MEMVDEFVGNEEVLASIEFRYCLKSEQNMVKAKEMSSSSYLENAFSPAQFVYDNRSFVSNASIVKNRLNQSLDS